MTTIITDEYQRNQAIIQKKCLKKGIDYDVVESLMESMKIKHFLIVYKDYSLEQLEALLPRK